MKTKYKSHRCSEITPSMHGCEVVVSGWVHQIRDLGGKKFIILRDGSGTIQITISRGEADKELLEVVEQLTLESVIMVYGKVKADPRAPRGVEIIPTTIKILNLAKKPLPLDVSGKVSADLDTRLRERVLDLRRKEMQAIVRIMNTVLRVIREYLRSQGFVEVFTPKIIAAATEGGANLFPVIYFGREAFLAQSPQLYKELLAASLERVFEIGPAWRAEESDTPYHLSEFISVDIEAAFMDYNDVMTILEEMIYEVLKAVNQENADDLLILNYKPPSISLPLPRITYKEAIDKLRQQGLAITFGDDLGTPELRVLSTLIQSPLYFIIDFPTKLRPFYTKPKDEEPELSESFDLVWRHLELASGSSRLYRKDAIIRSLKERGLNPENFEFFIKWFDYGMPPHAGWGLGLSRFMLMLTGRSNVKEVTLFPRDKKRLVP
ncbi:MAG TPA: aspartate--tRNA(Asn) ligase [Ignisphaera aggregans]|uniref:Aspartate--tRNA(Asp/Asn) ligase n=1 Tax=Ignisphaera aggregans TaxID=334771 RepID=A0A832Z3L8_9CREN|nr:aspartate--tRNA(Asn) ligase [Ignisphaera aggregans]